MRPKVEKPKPAPTPIVMPEVDDVAIEEARKKSIINQQRRTGRASTILTGNSGTRSTLG